MLFNMTVVEAVYQHLNKYGWHNNIPEFVEEFFVIICI